MAYMGGLQRIVDACNANGPAALPPSEFTSDLAIGNGLLPRGRYWVDTSTVGITGTWDIGNRGPFSDLQMKSISAWRETQQIADEDLDAMAIPYIVRVQPTPTETVQLSQEVQLSGKTLHDRLFLTTGFLYFKEKTPHDDLLLSAGVNNFPNYGSALLEPVHERLSTDNHSYSWYGQVDSDVTSQIQLTVGVRWTTETHWSRYEKGQVIPFSAIYDTNATASASPGVLVLTRPGGAPLHFKPMFDWQYGAPRFSDTPFTTTISGTQRTFYLPLDPIPGKFSGDELEYSNSAWTPMVSLKYKASDSALEMLSLDEGMAYVTYNTGFHSGGVTSGAVDTDIRTFPGYVYFPAFSSTPSVHCPGNTSSCNVSGTPVSEGYGTADPITFRPEKAVNYEVGFKISALNRRLQINADAFYMLYTDMQVTATGNRFGVPIPYVDNVGKSIIKGFELEAVALPTPQWRVTFNGSYTDADIKEWQSKIVLLDTDGTGNISHIAYTLDRSDERMPRVPRWQFFVASEYNIVLPGGSTLTPSFAVRFTSSIYHGFDRGSWNRSYGGYYFNNGGLISYDGGTAPGDALVPKNINKWATTARPTAFLDGRINWVSEDGKLDAALWAKNIMNKEDYLVGGIPLADVTGGVGQVYANPRTFGLTVTYHFGE